MMDGSQDTVGLDTSPLIPKWDGVLYKQAEFRNPEDAQLSIEKLQDMVDQIMAICL